MEAEDEDGSAVPGSSAEGGSDPRVTRLRQLVTSLGGNRSAARKSGVALSTLNGYLAGGGMKLDSAAALAQAAGVRLDWLATGEGPMRAAEADQALPPSGRLEGSYASRSAPNPLFSQIDADRLGDAYAAALQALAARGHSNAEPRRVMQVTILLYDELTEAEEEAAKSRDVTNDPATTGME